MDQHPHWARYFVDGGTLMEPRPRGAIVERGPGAVPLKTRGVYWSMLREVVGADKEVRPVLIRQQNLRFKTNNDAEWLAVREALQYAQNDPQTPIIIYSDSRLVVNQFNAVWRTKIARHHRLRDECRALALQLRFVVLEWRPRAVVVDKLGH